MARDWGLLTRITLLWFGVWVAALLFDHDLWALSRRGLKESLCWLLFLSALVSVPAVRTFVGGLDIRYRTLYGAAIAALMFGQFTGVSSNRTFPLVSWRMFGGEERTIQPFTFFELVGDASDGRRLPVNANRLFDMPKQPLTVGLSKVLDRALDEGAEPDQRRVDELRLRELLAAIGRVYNERHPHEPLRSLTVVWYRIDPTVKAEARISRRRAIDVNLGERAP